MARRDVDLVIKARDQAASVVESITDALNGFVEAQTRLDSRADKTETTLGALGSAIGQLDKQLKGLSAGSVLTEELAKAGTALARLEQKFESTQAEAAQLGSQLRQASNETERYASKLSGAAAAQERQSASLKKAVADQRGLTEAYEKAVTAQDKLARRQQQLPGLIDRASVAADKAARRFDDLSSQVNGTVNPTRRLKDQLESSLGSLTRTSERLSKLRGEYASIGGQLRAAGSAITLFGQASERATSDVARQETILKKIGQNYDELKGKSSAAAANQTKLKREFDKVTGTLARQTGEIARAQSEYAKVAASTDQARAAIQRLANGGLAQLHQAWTEQRRAVLEAKRAYVEARKEATGLGRSLAGAAAPSKELVAAFERAKTTSASLKGELLQQRQAYEQLGRTYRGTGEDIESVRAAQQRFAQTQESLRQKLAASGVALQRQVQSINRLNGVSGQAASNTRRLASEQARSASAADRAANANTRLAAAYRQFYGDSRRSLGLLQRIRGEVLSLVAAYGGLYAGIEALRLTVDATQQLEAAQARLNVAFDADGTRVAQELDFLRRTAERLGVNFGALATEYSKFQIATKNTAISAAAARKIFVQVTEAARVNRSSTKELSGVFVALTQIVSKGAVQMEELRQQLGDRLPGALQIMADGLKVGTAELIKMLEQGQVTEEALIGFGDELEKRFGGGLEEALSSLTVAFGRLSNAAFQAAVRFGQAGFIDGLQGFVEQLTETLNSADFQAFAARISQALAGLLDFLGFAVENFPTVITALAALIALKLVPVVLPLAAGLKGMGTSAVLATTQFTALQSRAAAMGVTVTRAGLAVRTLTRGLRALASTTGIGLAFVAISTAIASWSTSADSATEAMVAHREAINQVKDAYEGVSGAVGEWQAALQSISETELSTNVERLRGALVDLREERDAFVDSDDSFLTNFFGRDIRTGTAGFDVIRKYRQGIQQVFEDFEAGKIEADQLVDALDDVNGRFRDSSDDALEYGNRIIEVARSELELVRNIGDGEAALKAREGSLEDVAEAAIKLGLANEVAADALDPSKTRAFEAAMSSLKDVIEETAQKTEYLSQVMQIDGAFEDAIENAQTLEERIDAAITKAEALDSASQQYVDANFGGFTDGVQATAALLRDLEGFRATPYFDVNALRAGFGSDTVTLSDGTIKKVTQGMSVSVADANRDLIRRITTEFMPRVTAVTGQERFDSFTPQQQAALTSIAYNYGEIPDRIAEAVRSGSSTEIANAIRSLGGDNGGINRTRRSREAALFTSGAATETAIRESDRLLENERRRAELTADRIADNDFEIEQNKLINQEREREAAILAAVREAKEENPDISAAELDQIKQQTAALFDLEQAQKNVKDEKEGAVEAQEEVNRLLAIQTQLEEQLSIARERGDSSSATRLQGELDEVNEKLTQAIDNAIRMWQAIGGTEADVAISKLTTAKLRAQDLGTTADTTYLKWDRVAGLFVDGLSSAFDSFAQSVAEGTSIGEAARNAFLKFAADFLRQIAQMIIKQAVFNALKGTFGGTGFGSLIGIPTGHTGGLVGAAAIGSGNSRRGISPAAFVGAMRYHSGGIAGLRPGELPAILKQGEEVLTTDDPRHMLNGAAKVAGGSKSSNTKIVNAIDSASFLDDALSGEQGSTVIKNYIRANAAEIKSYLET